MDDQYYYNDNGEQQQQYYDDLNKSNEERVCRVYDNEDAFTAWVQFFLAVFALGSLYFKRHRESPRRKFETWFKDVSKQGIGAVYAHILNMLIAALIAEYHRGNDNVTLEDECAWYAINYLVDTTFGLLLALFFLRMLDYLANHYSWDTLKNSGVYHGPDSWKIWTHQVLAWVFVLTLVKFVLLFFMWLFSQHLAYWGSVLFGPMQSNIRFELLFVMIFFPGILNVIYFWIVDSYIKAEAGHAHAHEEVDHENDKSASLIERTDTMEGEADPLPLFPMSADADHLNHMLERTRSNSAAECHVDASCFPRTNPV